MYNYPHGKGGHVQRGSGERETMMGEMQLSQPPNLVIRCEREAMLGIHAHVRPQATPQGTEIIHSA